MGGVQGFVFVLFESGEVAAFGRGPPRGGGVGGTHFFAGLGGVGKGGGGGTSVPKEGGGEVDLSFEDTPALAVGRLEEGEREPTGEAAGGELGGRRGAGKPGRGACSGKGGGGGTLASASTIPTLQRAKTKAF